MHKCLFVFNLKAMAAEKKENRNVLFMAHFKVIFINTSCVPWPWRGPLHEEEPARAYGFYNFLCHIN